MMRLLVFPLLVLTLLIWASGCSEQTTEPDTTGELNLDSEFGGYTASAESPGFGEQDLMAETEADEEYDDPMLASPDVAEYLANPDAGYYHLRAVWGRLSYDSTVTEVTDWTGSLTISRGAEIIRRVIRFEDGQDFILERTDRKLIEWQSLTTVHNDGIAVDLLVPPLRPIFDTTLVSEVDSLGDTTWVTVVDTIIPDPVPVTLAFETGPYSRTFLMDELSALDTIVRLDDSNAVAFHALKLDHLPCPRGFLAGRWGFNEDGEGVFRGTWMNKRGGIDGHLHGHFGENEHGRKVFFGKWISASGEFEGFLKGTYGWHPNEHANGQAFRRGTGWFVGKIYNSHRDEIGVLKGRYGNSPEDSRGFLQGRWKLRCNDANTEAGDDGDGF